MHINRTTLRRALVLHGAFLLLAASQACADFYRYVGKDGVEIYTNIPMGEDAVRVLREQEERNRAEAEKQRKAAAKAEPQAAPERKPVVSRDLQYSRDGMLPVRGIVTSTVGWRRDPIDGTTRHHNGIDLAVPVGTSVKAIAAGTVVESGWHGGYGNLVTIDHGNGMISMYGHNSQLAVRAGDQVQAGQTVALSGSTGRSTGPHLHFELWDNGSNVTEAYFSKGARMPQVADNVRSYVGSDGSVVFTNKY